jgi:excisionase family DNA binding protein
VQPSHPHPGYLDLKTLAIYSSCSVRWLRDRLTDRNCALPFYRVGGKVLVKRDEFDAWMNRFRIASHPGALDRLVDSVVAELSA